MFALICTDKAGALDIRKANRDAHLAYIAETGVVFQAGPFLNDAGDMSGSLVILNVDDRAAAEAWAENDPYAKAGLFDKVRIEAWKKVVG
ncbi:YciI family protein [uncultured Maritimibacter sp.]|jgi:uncharacterized protein YciI|uniref:YciI family protein n=1 Tax=uncultured Maritimibacter sp. TaxID=991866 RepID=UPI000A666225|nr:YciI family protein [uncultured Maritimibacter sp.]